MVGLTEEDLERIEHFVNKPRYAREPDQLRPGSAADDGTEEDEESGGEGEGG